MGLVSIWVDYSYLLTTLETPAVDSSPGQRPARWRYFADGNSTTSSGVNLLLAVFAAFSRRLVIWKSTVIVVQPFRRREEFHSESGSLYLKLRWLGETCSPSTQIHGSEKELREALGNRLGARCCVVLARPSRGHRGRIEFREIHGVGRRR